MLKKNWKMYCRLDLDRLSALHWGPNVTCVASITFALQLLRNHLVQIQSKRKQGLHRTLLMTDLAPKVDNAFGLSFGGRYYWAFFWLIYWRVITLVRVPLANHVSFCIAVICSRWWLDALFLSVTLTACLEGRLSVQTDLMKTCTCLNWKFCPYGW